MWLLYVQICVCVCVPFLFFVHLFLCVVFFRVFVCNGKCEVQLRQLSDLIYIKLIANSNNSCWSLFSILSFSLHHMCASRTMMHCGVSVRSFVRSVFVVCITLKMMSDYDEVRLLCVCLCYCSCYSLYASIMNIPPLNSLPYSSFHFIRRYCRLRHFLDDFFFTLLLLRLLFSFTPAAFMSSKLSKINVIFCRRKHKTL